MRSLLFICLLSALVSAQATAPSNLLVNGNFADVKDRKPVGWMIAAHGHDIYVDKEDHPRDVPQALKVEIRQAADGEGGVLQLVHNVPANTKLVLSGIMMGSNRRLAYLQVTLSKAGRELKRERTDWNTDDWKLATVEFDSGDADQLSVECRFVQSGKTRDEKVWFADVRLVKRQP